MKNLCAFTNLAYASVVVCVMSFGSVSYAGTKVAFTGDQGAGENAEKVLKLIADEGTDLLMIQGDLGYDRGAAQTWENNLTKHLGESFPVLTTVGNHENFEWHIYHQKIKDRINRVSGLSCSGNPGVKALCQFSNLEVVQVAPGISEVAGVRPDDNYAEFIADKFSGGSNKWRICSWHKNMKDLQTGNKGNSTGWDVYRSCLNVGAMIAVAHEHAYSRTYLMSDFENRSVVHRESDMKLEPGRSFMFVSGLGGKDPREQKRGGDWWASIYTKSQGATHGALFCDFEVNTASCYFKAINGSVPDSFTLRRDGGSGVERKREPDPEPEGDVELKSVPAVFKRTDSDEYRWIDRDVNGNLGNVRIDSACTDTLGGPDLSGDWDDLVNLAPGVDSIANPCGSGDESDDGIGGRPDGPALEPGYVFQRTDKNEIRWIDLTNNGEVGSIRINNSCADKMGGATASGDWFDLMIAAPAFDKTSHPCNANGGQPKSSGGYVFSRTDKNEMRWIAKTASGEVGSIRISEACVRKLGVAPVQGNWKQLMKRAPKLDAVASPCS